MRYRNAFKKWPKRPYNGLVMKEADRKRELDSTRSELNTQKWVCLFATKHYRGRSRELTRRVGKHVFKIIVGKQFDGDGREIEVGVLRVPAYKVLVALFHIWESRGKPLDWVTSSLYELADVMDRRWGGSLAKELKDQLRSLRDIPIQWIGFFHRGEDRYISILEDQPLRFIKVKFLTTKRGGKEIESRFMFKFDERVLENLLLGYTKPVRLDVISKLSEIATLVYCHVDVVMADKNEYIRRSKELFEDLGLMSKRYRYPSPRKTALEKVKEELIGKPLTTGKLIEISLKPTKEKKDFKIRFVKEPFRRPVSQKSDAEVRELVEEMERVLGVGDKNRGFYITIARNCPAELIRAALKDTVEEERSGRITGSKAQFFGYWIQYLAAKRGIDLGLKSSFGELLDTG